MKYSKLDLLEKYGWINMLVWCELVGEVFGDLIEEWVFVKGEVVFWIRDGVFVLGEGVFVLREGVFVLREWLFEK